MSSKLTANFSREEFDAGGIPYPTEWSATKLPRLAAVCQWLRDLADAPGIITSCQRTPAHNVEVGGSATSQHLVGEAADVVFLLASLRTIARGVLSDVASHTAPPFGQIILYPRKGHVHASIPSTTLGSRNGQVLYSIDNAYFPLTRADELPILSDLQKRRGLQCGAALLLAAILLTIGAGGASSGRLKHGN